MYKINIQSQSLSDICFIDNYLKKVKNVLTKEVKLPSKIKRFVVVKSPHVNKKAKEHFQIKTHKRLYYLKGDYLSVKEMIQKIPSGISIKVTKVTSSSGNSAVR
jgi:small subunit ribosomal protein S10